MYTGTFSDFFSQAVIDFMLGHRSLSVFSEFLSTLASIDPRDIHRLYKIRASAIESCAALVLSEGETLQKGWTLLGPTGLNVKVANQFEEKVLLLVRSLILIHLKAALISFINRRQERRCTLSCVIFLPYETACPNLRIADV